MLMFTQLVSLPHDDGNRPYERDNEHDRQYSVYE